MEKRKTGRKERAKGVVLFQAGCLDYSHTLLRNRKPGI